ncbi:hypothetical protein CBR_g23778 [Chara braunii]|uniref:Uncharacterized protein n=1 Tax=Chara braunii TaxID=69332 RepID=A0A388JVS6_CHABU|nr:hypothetical protein CBR_g23778 [Chara braunii]|eukprot:GBG61822.1 hypothetical protein CBR_g23778 [Chara braunii]
MAHVTTKALPIMKCHNRLSECLDQSSDSPQQLRCGSSFLTLPCSFKPRAERRPSCTFTGNLTHRYELATAEVTNRWTGGSKRGKGRQTTSKQGTANTLSLMRSGSNHASRRCGVLPPHSWTPVRKIRSSVRRNPTWSGPRRETERVVLSENALLLSLLSRNPHLVRTQRTHHQPQRLHSACIRCSLSTSASASSKIEVDHVFSHGAFEQFLFVLQSSVCDVAAAADGSGRQFLVDEWQSKNEQRSGHGITRVLEGGDLLEKAAANVSVIRGVLSGERAKAMSSRGQQAQAGQPYFAGSLSLVFHSRHPFVPTFRSDIRYFEIEGCEGEGGGWFGGGADLTPSYIFEDDVREFHGYYRKLCDRYEPHLYPSFKSLCDKYFYLPARREHRGVGGIFFDDLKGIEQSAHGSVEPTPATGSNNREGDNVGGLGRRDKDRAFTAAYAFVREVGESFMPSYLPLAQRRRKDAYGEKERQWQLIRRGRYLEFNLLYDRGVRFGLDGGRIESIMVSAPPLIAWRYNVVAEEGSPEARLVQVLRNPQEWA